jgi:hypothetical protein
VAVAENLYGYSDEAKKIAKRAGIHPGEVEICADCGLLAPPLHPGCGARVETKMFAGYFSPNKKHGGKKGEDFTWRAAKMGWRVRLDAKADWRWRWLPIFLNVTVESAAVPGVGSKTRWLLSTAAFDIHVWGPFAFGEHPKMIWDVDRIWFQAGLKAIIPVNGE